MDGKAGGIMSVPTLTQPLLSVMSETPYVQRVPELVGNFKNNGREYRPKATPEAVNVHDFIDPNWDALYRMASLTSPTIRVGSASHGS